ncbi:DUF2867 domain-containing protein [Stenotrophobium rhamnosiphilum]|nr:DUF2867 domain-containing protein [Stenotrophobium rhamnosiphilum]
MKSHAVKVDPRLENLLPGFTFSDAYRVVGARSDLNARQAARAIFNSPPAWVNALMALRNWIVGWFGLKAGTRSTATNEPSRVGIFPIVLESPQEILLGMDDHHLDFRLIVTLDSTSASTQTITVTSLVKTHNRLGRVYLTMILPFHRLLARTMLARASLSGV